MPLRVVFSFFIRIKKYKFVVEIVFHWYHPIVALFNNYFKGEVMHKKIYNKSIFTAATLCFTLLSHHMSYAVIAYMPVVLRECLTTIYEVNGRDKHSNLEDLCAIIKENRVIVSDQMIRRVIDEALDILQHNRDFDNNWRDGAATYLKNYGDALNNKSVLCSLQDKDHAAINISSALLARSLEIDSMSKEIIYLSSQLANVQSIELCGNEPINDDFSHFMPTSSNNPNMVRASLVFNADMMSSPGFTSPNVVFGTGMNTPVVTAWAMPSITPRTMATRAPVTTPVTLQFSIPTDFKEDKSVSLKVHFLVEKQGFATGKARIQINALYSGDNDQFYLSDTTHIDQSKDFTVKEPDNVGEFRHVYVSIPLQKSHIKENKFAMITVSRVQPNGTEYAGDIYFVAAEFKYTQ